MFLRFRRHKYSEPRYWIYMKNTRRYASIAGLGILATILFASPLLAPTFAWSSSLSTCVGTSYSSECTVNPSYAIGTSVSDTAKLTLTSDGGPYGQVIFGVAAGTCRTVTGAPGYGSIITTLKYNVTGTGTTYPSVSVSTTGYSAGSYVWLVYYTGTGSGGYPRAPSTGYDCEPFTLYSAPPPTGVPEFPFGMALLMAAAIPALVLIKRKFSLPSIQAL